MELNKLGHLEANALCLKWVWENADMPDSILGRSTASKVLHALDFGVS